MFADHELSVVTGAAVGGGRGAEVEGRRDGQEGAEGQRGAFRRRRRLLLLLRVRREHHCGETRLDYYRIWRLSSHFKQVLNKGRTK